MCTANHVLTSPVRHYLLLPVRHFSLMGTIVNYLIYGISRVITVVHCFLILHTGISLSYRCIDELSVFVLSKGQF